MKLLGDYIIIEKGKLPPKLSETKSAVHHLPYVDIKAFEKGIIERYSDGQKSLFCNDGDILMVWDGARCGYTGKAIKGVVGSTLARITPKSELAKEYLLYLLKSLYHKLNTEVKGIGIPHLNPVLLNNSTFAPPSLPEQHRIVEKIEELFSELDNGITNLKEAKEQLIVYRQSVLKWAFEGRLTNEVKKDGELPDGWSWAKIENVCKNVEYGSSAKSDDTGLVPVIRMGNIQNGMIVWDDLKYTSNKAEISKYLLKTNDVLFNRTNSPELVGKTAIYKGERPAIFAGYLIRINWTENLINPSFLNYYLNSETARHYGNSVKTDGVNQSNINGHKLKQYPIPVPPLEVQEKIAKEINYRFLFAYQMEKRIDESLQQAEALRQSILKSAFEGRLII